MGVELSKLVWVRCGGNAEHALRAADLLIQAGGFGVVALDLAEAAPAALNRIPPTAWFRFRLTSAAGVTMKMWSGIKPSMRKSPEPVTTADAR